MCLRLCEKHKRPLVTVHAKKAQEEPKSTCQKQVFVHMSCGVCPAQGSHASALLSSGCSSTSILTTRARHTVTLTMASMYIHGQHNSSCHAKLEGNSSWAGGTSCLRVEARPETHHRTNLRNDFLERMSQMLSTTDATASLNGWHMSCAGRGWPIKVTAFTNVSSSSIS